MWDLWVHPLVLFLKGMVVGVTIAMPVGPVGLLCLQRAVTGGVRMGLASGFGAALGDSLYGLVAAMGLTVVSSFLTGHAFWLKLVGGGFLVGIGCRMYAEKEVPHFIPEQSSRHMAGSFMSTFFLTLANPMTFLAFAVIFAGLGLGQPGGGLIHGISLVLGVFCGSGLWWLAIAFGGPYLRDKLAHRLGTVHKISALVIIAFGLLALATIWLPKSGV